jgi:hypothetical protein
MNRKVMACERENGSRSTRRDFNARLAALLLVACVPLPVVSAPSPDNGRWILNERDH